MAILTLQDAEDLANRGRPWTLRMEHRIAQAPASIPGQYWIATGRAKDEPVEVHTGALGSKTPAIIQVKDWTFIEQVAKDKEAKGWDYKWTNFVRVRQQTIDAHAQRQTVVVVPAAPVSQSVGVQAVQGIVAVQPVPGKSGFNGLDATGAVVRVLTAGEAQDLVQQHKIPIRWV